MKLKEKCPDHVGIICDVGGKYKGNQDSALYHEFSLIIAPASSKSRSFSYNGILALVADGVSGSNHGEEGSSFTIRRFTRLLFDEFFEHTFHIESMQSQIEKCLAATNQQLQSEFAQYIKEGAIPKSTIVGMIVIGQWLWVFNLGDSRAYVIKDGLIQQISLDHVGESTAHEITQAMGQENISPYIKIFNWAFENNSNLKSPTFQSQYYALLCSDGLTDKVSNEEINQIITSNTPDIDLQEKVQKLYDLSLEREIDDNVSIIAINLAHYFYNLNKIQIIKLNPRGASDDSTA